MNNNLEDEELEEFDLDNQEKDFIEYLDLEEEYLEGNIEPVYNNYNQLKQNFRNNNKNTTNSLKEKIQKNKTKNLFNKNKSSDTPQKNNLDDDNEENKNKKKNSTLSEKANNLVKDAGQKVKNTAKEAGKKAAKTVGKAVFSGIKVLMTNPLFWVIAGVLLLIFLIPVLWGAYDSGSSGSSSNANITKSSEISLKRTSLTKSEFVAFCNKQSGHSEFYDNCDKIYDISIKNNFNPEMVVIRATVEGFSPGASKNNYWGLGCYNTGGYNACISYSTFEAGVEGFIKNVSQYETIDEMMSKYAFIGYNWYNPGGSGVGGCYYYPYIKKYMSAGRANTVGNYCSENNYCQGTMCQPTNDEDQLAYAKWQVSKMVSVGKGIFGSVTEDVVDFISSNVPKDVEDLKTRYYFTFDKESYLATEPAKDKHNFAQCVWYAYHRAMDIVASSNLSQEEKDKRIHSLTTHSSDGGNYVNAMEGAVFKKTTDISNIKAPAVISWRDGSYGHVGIIESITTNSDGSKTYLISEGWRTRDANCNSSGRCTGWASHLNMNELWAVTNYNSAEVSSISSYKGGKFVAAASLLE